VWLATCVWFWRRLVERAADSGDLYARSASFQLLNFLIQYFWFFALVLGAVLACEWVIFWMVGRLRPRNTSR
jgi:hypothetical protein